MKRLQARRPLTNVQTGTFTQRGAVYLQPHSLLVPRARTASGAEPYLVSILGADNRLAATLTDLAQHGVVVTTAFEDDVEPNITKTTKRCFDGISGKSTSTVSKCRAVLEKEFGYTIKPVSYLSSLAASITPVIDINQLYIAGRQTLDCHANGRPGGKRLCPKPYHCLYTILLKICRKSAATDNHK
jgi:hypothetical protein